AAEVRSDGKIRKLRHRGRRPRRYWSRRAAAPANGSAIDTRRPTPTLEHKTGPAAEKKQRAIVRPREASLVPRACSICTHPELASIAKAISAGEPIRPLARRFKIPSSNLQRHAWNCQRIPRKQEAVAQAPARTLPESGTRFESGA